MPTNAQDSAIFSCQIFTGAFSDSDQKEFFVREPLFYLKSVIAAICNTPPTRNIFTGESQGGEAVVKWTAEKLRLLSAFLYAKTQAQQIPNPVLQRLLNMEMKRVPEISTPQSWDWIPWLSSCIMNGARELALEFGPVVLTHSLRRVLSAAFHGGRDGEERNGKSSAVSSATTQHRATSVSAAAVSTIRNGVRGVSDLFWAICKRPKWLQARVARGTSSLEGTRSDAVTGSGVSAQKNASPDEKGVEVVHADHAFTEAICPIDDDDDDDLKSLRHHMPPFRNMERGQIDGKKVSNFVVDIEKQVYTYNEDEAMTTEPQVETSGAERQHRTNKRKISILNLVRSGVKVEGREAEL